MSQQSSHDRVQSFVGRPVGHPLEVAEEQRESDRAQGVQTRAQGGLAEPHPATDVSTKTACRRRRDAT